jgi:alpha,alpha-trehalose phosphorylase
MIEHPAYTNEPWAIRECSLDLNVLAQTESVFALSNGHLGLRGNLDEGEPFGLPGTYLNSVYELRPLPYAEAGYGYPESGQTLINVTNGKLFRLLVDDEPFDVRYGALLAHERVLDFRAGTLARTAEWASPSGSSVRVQSQRLVSFTQRAIAAIRYCVEPLGRPVRIVVQSELVANETLPDAGTDPRVAAVLSSPLVSEEHGTDDGRAFLVHRTRASELRVAAAMDHTVDAPDELETRTDSFPDVARFTVATTLEPGQRLEIVKLLAYGWSATRSKPAVRDQVIAALSGARLSGWDGLAAEQREYLDRFWSGGDVEVDGDPEIQQAVRFALFHVLQSGARAERRPIPAKGLTGPGYDGHTFWDMETFVLPVLTYTEPRAAADALRWRHSIIPIAQERARQLGLEGAAFPWRTIAGAECSGYWPAGTAAFHVNADISDAVVRYVEASDDEEFEKTVGLEILVETARLWRSLGHHDAHGRFRIDGVTGPDEYSALADNNVYTNLMAQKNLNAAADTSMRYPDEASRLGVTTEEAASWRDAASAIFIPYDDRLGVHPQSETFTEHAVWDFAATSEDEYPLLLHFPYFDLYRKQVVKQADLVLAMQLRGEAFTDEQKARNFAYYEPITVRDSSLSAATQAVMAAEVGHLELAHDYLGEAALMDLWDLERNTRDGLHIAALAGSWTALVAGLGGMRARRGRLWFSPALPSGIRRLAFRVRHRGCRLGVDVTHDAATYQLFEGEEMTIAHDGQDVTVGRQPTSRPVRSRPTSPRPAQPPGREPRARHLEAPHRQPPAETTPTG